MYKALATGCFLLGATVAFAQPPDPLDSVIIQSKTVFPFSGPCQSAGLKIRVWITHKDSLANVTIPVQYKSVSGGAYATLSRPTSCFARNFASVIIPLIPSNQLKSRINSLSNYHSQPPDTSGTFFTLSDPTDDLEKLEPSLTRRPLMDIKFDTVLANIGLFELDSVKFFANDIQFVNLFGQKIKVNFVKGVIDVSSNIPPGDSVIIESKYIPAVNGFCGTGFAKIRVWFTNRARISSITLPLLTTSIFNGGYATLSRHEGCSLERLIYSVFDVRIPSSKLPVRSMDLTGYHSNSPDTLMLTLDVSSLGNDSEILDSNLNRQPLVDIRFDTVLAVSGQFSMDSVRLASNSIRFRDEMGSWLPVNFVKGTFIVIQRGDLNADGVLTPADQVLMLNCVFCSSCTPPLSGRDVCDMNCDALSTSSDVVLLLNRIFLGTPLPC